MNKFAIGISRMTSATVHGMKSGKERTILAAESLALHMREIKQNRPPKEFYSSIRSFRNHEADLGTVRAKKINQVFYFMKKNAAKFAGPEFPEQIKRETTKFQPEIRAQEAVLAGHASGLVSRFRGNDRADKRLEHWEAVRIFSGIVGGATSFPTLMALGDFSQKILQTGFGAIESIFGAIIAGSISLSFYAHSRIKLLRTYKRAEELSKKPRLVGSEEIRASPSSA